MVEINSIRFIQEIKYKIEKLILMKEEIKPFIYYLTEDKQMKDIQLLFNNHKNRMVSFNLAKQHLKQDKAVGIIFIAEAYLTLKNNQENKPLRYQNTKTKDINKDFTLNNYPKKQKVIVLTYHDLNDKKRCLAIPFKDEKGKIIVDKEIDLQNQIKGGLIFNLLS